MTAKRVPITPATRVAELLESWPELEEVLVAQAPAFRRLKNPLLRRTVARVATLEQAAGVGGLAVRDLVATLRRAAGLGPTDVAETETPLTVVEPPGWVATAPVVDRIDAEALLDAGEVPLARVNRSAAALGEREVLRVDSRFRPLPLLEALAKQGYGCSVREEEGGRFVTLVWRERPPRG